MKYTIHIFVDRDGEIQFDEGTPGLPPWAYNAIMDAIEDGKGEQGGKRVWTTDQKDGRSRTWTKGL